MTYDLSKLVKTSKCPVCGVPWGDHDESCSRHAYRPTIRIDANGCDVSELSGLWGEEDTFYYPAEPVAKPAKKRRRAKA